MNFTFVTLFPNLVYPYFEDSILSRAKELNIIDIDCVNPRDFSLNKHKKVDDYKAGGGAGLLMSPQPLYDTLDNIKQKDSHAYFIFPLPVAKNFTQKDAKRLSEKNHIVFICGRYEGIDERVIEKYADEVFSVGDFVLTGGELPSLCMCDAISRMVEGVLGNEESLTEESFEDALLEAPSFTKPNIYNDVGIPSDFLKGNHAIISSLKNRMAHAKTCFHRPDLEKKVKTYKRKNYEK
ncbi:MAG: tRNA (guanosine(37)-N1)-methyltransferase TrmD [Campylobacteraceae bacterium]|jgi:tRNA (guanine37-N1)-methyltransferase|nr:tRNA (guanosine(37)-N1)-methyltransferase TrmD [Campylobacteraceae bacterium]